MVNPNFKKGIYNVPHTILHILGLQDNRVLEDFKGCDSSRIVFILVDGMGINVIKTHFGEKFQHYTLLTSLFPSTTANVLTTILTGLSPRQHGILEYRLYYEVFGNVIKTLPFSPLDASENDVLLKMGVSPEKLFHLPTIFEKLEKEGIKSAALIRREYSHTSYTHNLLKGANIVPYSSLEDAFVKISKRKEALLFVYIDYLDTVEHRYGPNSPQTAEMLGKILYQLENLRRRERGAIMVTADHGLVEIKRKIILDLHCPFPLGGSPRDVFLYSCNLDDVEGYGIEILPKKEIISSNILGPGEENIALEKRAPDHLLLPPENVGVWDTSFELKGLHGGLSPEEMLIPFIFIPEKS